MSDEAPRRDGPPKFDPDGATRASVPRTDTQRQAEPRSAPRASELPASELASTTLPPTREPTPPQMRSADDHAWPNPQESLQPQELSQAQAAPTPQAAPTSQAAQQWALPNPHERVSDSGPTSTSSWDPPVAQTAPVTASVPGVRLRKTMPKNVAIALAVIQLVVVGCLSIVVFRFLQFFNELAIDSSGELLILLALSGTAIVTAFMHIKPRASRGAAALCAVAGGVDIFSGYRYRELLGFVDFAAEFTESSSRVIVQIAWLTPFVGVGFVLVAAYHLFRSFE